MPGMKSKTKVTIYYNDGKLTSICLTRWTPTITPHYTIAWSGTNKYLDIVGMTLVNGFNLYKRFTKAEMNIFSLTKR